MNKEIENCFVIDVVWTFLFLRGEFGLEIFDGEDFWIWNKIDRGI